MERREKFDKVKPLNDIVWPRCAPGFFQGRRRALSAARRKLRNEDAHGGRLPEPEVLEKREFHWQSTSSF